MSHALIGGVTTYSPPIEPESRPTEACGSEVFDAIIDSRGGVRGPYGVLLHSPDLAARVAHTGSYMRYNLDLPEALREIIILATAREIKSQYEFVVHARLARQAGLSEDFIKAIAQGTAPQGLSGDEEKLVRYVQELLRHHKISDATFNAVRDRFGMQKTLEITGLIGHYLLVGQILAAFDVDLPEGQSRKFPISPWGRGSAQGKMAWRVPRLVTSLYAFLFSRFCRSCE
jgi:4-carboxymuconolactone decarboxylase